MQGNSEIRNTEDHNGAQEDTEKEAMNYIMDKQRKDSTFDFMTEGI